MWKNRLYTAINILGLSLALACCSIIILHIRFEFSFDNFHKNRNRIARILNNNFPITPYVLSSVLREYFPEIEEITKLSKFNDGGFYVKSGDRLIPEKDLVYADSSFFDVFSFPVVSGNTEQVLQSPDRIMVSSSFASKYFKEESCTGQSVSLRVNDKTYDFTIEGVFSDLPSNSHIHANVLLSLEFMAQQRNPASLINWGNSFVFTYVLTAQPDMTEQINSRMPGLIERYVPPAVAEGLKYRLQLLKHIHLYSKDLTMDIEPQGSITRVIIFASIAVLVLLIAMVNFMLISLALSIERIHEFGMRKVIGAQRKELISLVTIDFIIIFILSLQISLMVIELFLPAAERYMNLKIAHGLLPNFITIAVFLIVVSLLGYLSGIIIANRVSRFKPVDAIRNNIRVNRLKLPSRGALVVFQFTVMIILLSCLIGMQKQISMLHGKELGFEPDGLVSVKIPGNVENGYARIKEELSRIPFISNVSGAAYLPPSSEFWLFDLTNTVSGEKYQFEEINADYDFTETMGIEILQGRSFSKDHLTDSTAMIINESALRKLGVDDVTDFWLKGPDYYPERARLNIIGVFRDFHARSLYDQIQPMAIMLSPSMVFQMVIRISANAPGNSMEIIRERWSSVFPEDPMEYTFVEEGLQMNYRQEHRLFATISLFTLLSVVISLLGLFGLSIFVIRRRTMEIGLRKVYGSSDSGIIYLLTKQFTLWIFFAMLIAVPLAWYIMNRWMEHFAYKTTITWWIFALASAISLAVAMLTISRQTFIASSGNPVELLHYE